MRSRSGSAGASPHKVGNRTQARNAMLEKAQALGITQLSEAQLLELLEDE